MHCDYGWRVREPDLAVQKRAGWFFETYAKQKGWRYSASNGLVDGYFLDLESLAPVSSRTARHLIGVSIFPEFTPALDEPPRFGEHQYSFIFDNTENDHYLVTIDRILDFESDARSAVRPQFDRTPMDAKDDIYAIVSFDGFHRWSARYGDWELVELLRTAKSYVLPNLDWWDDEGDSGWYGGTLPRRRTAT